MERANRSAMTMKKKKKKSLKSLGEKMKNLNKSENLKAPRPKTAAPRRRRHHPPYFEMIKEALLSLKERKGSSPHAIAKFMEEKYNSLRNLPLNFRKILGVQLKNCVVKGKLMKIKASYKLVKNLDKEKEKEEEQEQSSSSSSSSEEVDLKILMPYINLNDIPKKKSKITEEDKEEFMNNLPGYQAWCQVVRDTSKDNDDTKAATEACLKYMEKVIQSQGFDCDGFPRVLVKPSIVPRISPLPSIESDPWIHDVCRKALARFNTLNKTRFRYGNLVKANILTSVGYTVFATFKATATTRRPRSADRNSCVTFQARGFHSVIYPEDGSIDFCRVKKEDDAGAGGSVENKSRDEFLRQLLDPAYPDGDGDEY